MSTCTDFPAPFRHNGRLVWDKFEWENYKRGMLGLAPLERDPTAAIIFISANSSRQTCPSCAGRLGATSRGGSASLRLPALRRRREGWSKKKRRPLVTAGARVN